jgi:hypothetical protein
MRVTEDSAKQALRKVATLKEKIKECSMYGDEELPALLEQYLPTAEDNYHDQNELWVD